MMSGNLRHSLFATVCAVSVLLTGCAWVNAPDARNVNIPSPVTAAQRQQAINERPDSVMYLPLGEDVLVPEALEDERLPSDYVGPFELRGETLAGALQLILSDYDVSLAFETDLGLSRRVTVANLRGDLETVVNQVCSLANLYCSYENGAITVKETQTFTVTLPPLGSSDGGTNYLQDVAQGLGAILNVGNASGTSPVVDPTTRTIVYNATQRTASVASRYFQRLRANTAMIVFETYIWEVSLNAGNSTGINWNMIDSIGKFNTSIALSGGPAADFLNPVSIGLPTASDIGASPDKLLEFLSQFGAVKTISQPQITVLSGAEAELRVADTRNYVSEISTTLDQGQSTTAVTTDSVDSGFTLTIGSSWDKSTVYANIAIELTNVQEINDFSFADTGDDGGQTRVQLPQTTERQLSTQIRVRPGDSVLIAGLVRENDNFNSRGIGLMAPIIPDSRTAQTDNLELVILLRPRVVVYTAPNDKNYVDHAQKKHAVPGANANVSPKTSADTRDFSNLYTHEAPEAAPSVLSPAPALENAAPAAPESVPPSAPTPLPLAVETSPAPAPSAPPVSAPSALPESGRRPSLIEGRVSPSVPTGQAIMPARPAVSAPPMPPEADLSPVYGTPMVRSDRAISSPAVSAGDDQISIY